jgi:hypothetical protein
MAVIIITVIALLPVIYWRIQASMPPLASKFVSYPECNVSDNFNTILETVNSTYETCTVGQRLNNFIIKSVNPDNTITEYFINGGGIPNYPGERLSVAILNVGAEAGSTTCIFPFQRVYLSGVNYSGRYAVFLLVKDSKVVCPV